MTQHYSNPKRESDPNALPDVETFYVGSGTDTTGMGCDAQCRAGHSIDCELRQNGTEPGWYWQACFPGCLPDGEPNGPFDTEAEAVADAQSEAWQDDDEVRS